MVDRFLFKGRKETYRPYKKERKDHGNKEITDTNFRSATKKYAHSTALSKYVWDCKHKIKQTPEISWKIVKSAPAYTDTSKRCVLCLEEKMAIITYPDHTAEIFTRRVTVDQAEGLCPRIT